MLRLKVTPASEGYKVTGALGGYLHSGAHGLREATVKKLNRASYGYRLGSYGGPGYGPRHHRAYKQLAEVLYFEIRGVCEPFIAPFSTFSLRGIVRSTRCPVHTGRPA